MSRTNLKTNSNVFFTSEELTDELRSTEKSQFHQIPAIKSWRSSGVRGKFLGGGEAESVKYLEIYIIIQLVWNTCSLSFVSEASRALRVMQGFLTETKKLNKSLSNSSQCTLEKLC